MAQPIYRWEVGQRYIVSKRRLGELPAVVEVTRILATQVVTSDDQRWSLFTAERIQSPKTYHLKPKLEPYSDDVWSLLQYDVACEKVMQQVNASSYVLQQTLMLGRQYKFVMNDLETARKVAALLQSTIDQLETLGVKIWQSS